MYGHGRPQRVARRQLLPPLEFENKWHHMLPSYKTPYNFRSRLRRLIHTCTMVYNHGRQQGEGGECPWNLKMMTSHAVPL